MDKYMKFSDLLEYLRNRNDEARRCGHEETYFDLLTIINGLENVETVPASALGKDAYVPSNSALNHIHNVVKDDAYKRGYEQGKADVAPKWISMSERPPKEEGDYIVTDEAAGIAERLIDKYIRRDDGEWVWLYSQHVTAWMPLPKPWKGE